ncbi:MAG: carbohydrate binding domain-containing protein [Bacilli bacterium]|nr:carbohydrate binding domain-containing protein [Bacilli bacterium]
MKKIFTLLLTFIALFALVACKTNNPGGEGGEGGGGSQQGGTTYTAGITAETSSFELKVGDKLNALEGVKAIDENGNDLTSQIEVSHLIPLDEEGCVKQSGTYQIKYVITINGQKYNLYRSVTVIFELPQSDDLVVNGDFELGATDPFTKSEFDNGGATLSVVKNGESHELKVDITAVSWQKVSPRVETNEFTLTNGKYYKLSFKARADEARSIQVQVGQLLSENPWFNGLADINVDLTTTMQEFEVSFLADGSIASDLTKIQVLFGFGTQPEGKSSAQTACYLDDIKVEETKIASLLNVASLKGELGDEDSAIANPEVATVWFDRDGWVGAASPTTFSLEDGIIKINGTQPSGSCWFATQLFLYSSELQAGNYTLSFNLKLNKDGNIKYAVNDGSKTALKAVNSGEVVNGDNTLSLTFNLLEAGKAGLSIQFGTEAGGNIGAFEAEVSEILLVRNGDPVIVDYADPTCLLGTIKGSKIGGETDANGEPYTFFVWYVQDAGWNLGPVCVTNQSYADGALTVTSNLTAEHWWFATQIFYATEAIEAAGTHTVSFKLNASAAGTITINGTKVDIVAGDNNIEFAAEVNAGAKFVLSIQLGWEEKVEGANPISHQYLGSNTLVLSEFKMDGVAAKVGSSQGNEGEGEDDGELISLKSLKAEMGEEGIAVANPGQAVVWYDRDGWVGAASPTTFSLEDGVIKINGTQPSGSCWFATQLFLYSKELQPGSYTLSFNLKLNKAGKVKFAANSGANNAIVAIASQDVVAGDNTLTVTFELTAASKAGLSLQFGTEANGNIGAFEAEVSNIAIVANE